MAWEKIEEGVLRWISENPDLWDEDEVEVEEEVHERLRDSKHRGPARVDELLNGHPRRFRELFRLTKPVFRELVQELEEAGVKAAKEVSIEEKLMYTLLVVGHGWNTRNIQEFFIRSASPVCKYVGEVLDALNALARKYICMPRLDKNPWIESRSDLFPYFAGAIGAVDGTHIQVIVPEHEQAPFRDRGGGLSQNVLAVVDWYGNFIYTLVGWEGSAHDGRLWVDAKSRGFVLPMGYYVLGDAGFPAERMILTPYRRVRYHLKEWGNSRQRPRTAAELYNRRHASARSIVERTFGVVKARFRILTAMRPYRFEKQCKIVQACFVLHNFIRRHGGGLDEDFEPQGAEEEGDDFAHDIDDDIEDQEAIDMNNFRDQLATWMFRDYQDALRSQGM